MSPDTKRPLIIYHAGCKDGFGAAWIFHRQFGEMADYHPAAFGDAPPDVGGRNVYIVDFSYPKETLLEMAASAQHITLLDHHKTAEADLKEVIGMYPNILKIIFDMERSGAGLAWDYIHPNLGRPLLIDYVEDRDLWRHKLPNSREVNAYLQYLPYSFKAWEQASNMQFDTLLTLGKEFARATWDKHNANIEILMQEVDIWGYADVPVINHPTEGISELMEMMLERTGSMFAVGWRVRKDGHLSLSFRSKQGPESFDVSELAKGFGGGGHRNASGAELKGMEAVEFVGVLVHAFFQKGNNLP